MRLIIALVTLLSLNPVSFAFDAESNLLELTELMSSSDQCAFRQHRAVSSRTTDWEVVCDSGVLRFKTFGNGGILAANKNIFMALDKSGFIVSNDIDSCAHQLPKNGIVAAEDTVVCLYNKR